MIRWLVSLWRGPLCDAGTGHGARTGCLKTAVHTTLVHPAGWSRGFRWCEEHKDAAGQAVFGAWGAVRSTPAPTDAQVLDADAELAALLARLATLEDLHLAADRLIAALKQMRQQDAVQLAAAVAERDDLRRANAAGSAQVEVLRKEIARLEKDEDGSALALVELAAAVSRTNKKLSSAETKLAAAEELAALWDRQIEEYPATSEGRFAAAAVKLCGEELRVRLRPPKPTPHPGLVDLGLESDEEEPQERSTP